jgi:hypothetical protein
MVFGVNKFCCFFRSRALANMKRRDPWKHSRSRALNRLLQGPAIESKSLPQGPAIQFESKSLTVLSAAQATATVERGGLLRRSGVSPSDAVMRSVFAFLAPEDLHALLLGSTRLKRFTDTFVREHLRFLRIESERQHQRFLLLHKDDWQPGSTTDHQRDTRFQAMMFCAARCQQLHTFEAKDSPEYDEIFNTFDWSPKLAK